MKKLLSLILLVGLLALPANGWAAAATITSRTQMSLGNFAGVSGIVTLNSADTIATGLSSVVFFTLNLNPASLAGEDAISGDFKWSASGGTVTVYTQSNGGRYRFFAIGGP